MLLAAAVVCSPETSRPLIDLMQKVRVWDPAHWRFRAEETRTVADQMTHEEARTIMRRIAFKVQLPHHHGDFHFA